MAKKIETANGLAAQALISWLVLLLLGFLIAFIGIAFSATK